MDWSKRSHRNHSPTRCTKRQQTPGLGPGEEGGVWARRNSWVSTQDRYLSESNAAYGPRGGTLTSSFSQTGPPAAGKSSMSSTGDGTNHWIRRYKAANDTRTAGLVSGPTEAEIKLWRNELHKPNRFLPQIDPHQPDTWGSHYADKHSNKVRVYNHKSVLPVAKGTFDKITKKHNFNYQDDVMRPFMASSLDAQEKKSGYTHAGKDTQESAGWDGSMKFDAVYSEKFTKRDTASQIVFG